MRLNYWQNEFKELSTVKTSEQREAILDHKEPGGDIHHVTEWTEGAVIITQCQGRIQDFEMGGSYKGARSAAKNFYGDHAHSSQNYALFN